MISPPAPCPVCGAYSVSQDGQSSVLLAVCDVLVLKALEKIGSRIVRAERSRHGVLALSARAMHDAHTIWPLEDDEIIDKALKGAWDVVPALLDGRGYESATAVQIEGMLDAYVHDLAVTGQRHSLPELAHRFQECLSLPVYLHIEVNA